MVHKPADEELGVSHLSPYPCPFLPLSPSRSTVHPWPEEYFSVLLAVSSRDNDRPCCVHHGIEGTLNE